MGRSFLCKLCVLAGALSLAGCYQIPSDAKEFLEDYNERHPAIVDWEQYEGESLESFETYEEQLLTFAEWQKTDHYKTIMSKAERKADNITYILANIPENGILQDTDGNTILTFDGTVKIESIGTIEFLVVYPEIKQRDYLTLIETVGTIKYQIVRKQLATAPVD